MKNGSYCCCFLLDSMWLFWRNFLWISCGILSRFLCNSCENLVYSCENLVYARGLPWGITARQCPQEIAFGILELTIGGVLQTLTLQCFPNIASDNHILSEWITCSLLKPQVSICACTVEYIAITYVLVMRIPSKPMCFHAVLQLCLLFFFWVPVGNSCAKSNFAR